jgi:hypothetical protein
MKNGRGQTALSAAMSGAGGRRAGVLLNANGDDVGGPVPQNGRAATVALLRKLGAPE